MPPQTNPFLDQLRAQISQGDIFINVPFPKFLPEFLPELNVLITTYPAILLTDDCEFDKPKTKEVIFAEIKPLNEVQQGSRDNIRNFRTYNTYYLPATGALQESYVDFRKIGRIPKDFLAKSPSCQRIGSLTDIARLALQRQIALYFGFERREVPAQPPAS